MKKLSLLVIATVALFLNACTGPAGPAGPQGNPGPLAEVFELKGINFFRPNPLDDRNYLIEQRLTPNIFADDVLLVYRLAGTINPTTPIWQSVPFTFFSQAGALDYSFDFSKEDFNIYASGNYNLSQTPNLIQNQTFRIVIIPGFNNNKSTNNVNLKDYNAVVKHYKLENAVIKQL
jgi:hypothetical protein